MVLRSFLFVFHAGSRGLGSNNSRNSSYKEKTAGSARVSRLSFRFLWLWCSKCQMRHKISICTKDTKTLYAKENKMLQIAVACVSNVQDYETSTFSRFLFDNCSQRTYITTSLKKKLKLRIIRKENILIQRFASDEGHIEELDVVDLCLRGKTKNLNYYVEALYVPYICIPLKELRNYKRKVLLCPPQT